MPLPEIIFELPASQYERMGFPVLKQGQPLEVILDAGVLLPDPSAASWFAVQPQSMPPALVSVERSLTAFCGPIKEAEISTTDGQQSATLLVDCGIAPVRVLCAPQEDGLLPYGTWETRYLTGVAPLQGIVEDDFRTSIGQSIGVTIWGFHRLMLAPGGPNFGQWSESVQLPPTPYRYDRVFIVARVHKRLT